MMCGQKRYLSQELNRQKRGKDEDGRGLGEERLGDGAAGEESMVEEEYQPSLPRNDTHILDNSSTHNLLPKPCMNTVGIIKKHKTVVVALNVQKCFLKVIYCFAESIKIESAE